MTQSGTAPAFAGLSNNQLISQLMIAGGAQFRNHVRESDVKPGSMPPACARFMDAQGAAFAAEETRFKSARVRVGGAGL